MVGILISALAAGLYLMLSAGAPAHAHEVNCGDTITEEVVLQRDLDCELGAGEHGLTVQGPATLDLGGFNVSCEGSGGDSCVALVGVGGRLESGGVRTGRLDRSSRTPAVRVAGVGEHTVKRIEASAGMEIGTASTAFVVESDRNRLEQNRSIGENEGFVVDGNDNFLLDNTSVFSTSFSFFIRGSNNRLESNTVLSSETAIIFVQGPYNFLSGNRIGEAVLGRSGIILDAGADFTTVLGNMLTDSFSSDRSDDYLGGINVSSDHNLIVSNSMQDLGAPDDFASGIALRDGATDNVVQGNRVVGAVTDLVDENRHCDSNVWLANVYETVNQPCVALRLRRRAPPSRP